MAVGVGRKLRGKRGRGGESALYETVAEEELLRKEVASMLHSSVQSRLSACNLWLAKAEELLLNAPPPPQAVLASTGGPKDLHRDGADVVERIVGALELLHKVRAEVEQLRKQDVQQAVRKLYPTLISLGLRPALEVLHNELAQGEQREGTAPAIAVRWRFTENFAKWDKPDEDDEAIAVRLELYRFIEGLLRAARAAADTLAASEAGNDPPDEPPLVLRIDFDLRDGAIHTSGSCGLGDDGPAPEALTKFLAGSLPARRFRAAGGTMLVGSDARGRFQVVATLPAGIASAR